MCVIAVSEPGHPLPSEDIIRQCWESNHDGAGFMWADGRRVRIRKGFMKLGRLLTALGRIPDATQRAVVIHFRMATSGARDESMTHPFPLKPDADRLGRTSIEAAAGVAHNGILGSGEGALSDTAVFVRDVLSPLGTKVTLPELHPVISAAARGDRLAILTGDGRLSMTGKWQSLDGIHYSNLHWQRVLALPRYERRDHGRRFGAGHDPLFDLPLWWHDDDDDMTQTGELLDDGNDFWTVCPKCGEQFTIA